MIWRARGWIPGLLLILPAVTLTAFQIQTPSRTFARAAAATRDSSAAPSQVDEPTPVGAGADGAAVPAPSGTLAEAGACPLCTLDASVPIRVLTAEDVLAIGHTYADSSVTSLARIDSLLAAGNFGPPKTADARRKAHLMARLLTPNAYSYMIRLATSRDTVYEASETTLRRAFETFSEPGVYPIARLQRARMGRGHMCARYDLSEKMETSTILGGERLQVRVDDVEVEGSLRRVMIMDLPTGLFDVVPVLIAAEVTSDVEYTRSDGPPAPYELYLIDHLRGIWVHKLGTHRPTAFMFWVTPRDPRRTTLPDVPLIGVRIYAPHLRLRLPWILPDLRFENLREIDLPQPIMELDYLRQHRYPRWLKPAKMRGFTAWEGVGALPTAIRQRFPNL